MAGGNLWTNTEIETLERCYEKQMSSKEIACLIPRHSRMSAESKACSLGFTKKYIKTNSGNFKAEYQNYEWCYNKIVIEGKMPKEIAKETGYSKRVIEKWACEKFKLTNRNFKKLATLTDKQVSLIIAGTLGDGHIDKRENCPIYIESHAPNLF